MEGVQSQLAIPGQYTALYRNVVAPDLRQQLDTDNKILHFSPAILNHKKVFREDEFTSKIGGLPVWLAPSPPPKALDDYDNDHDSEQQDLPGHQRIPCCAGCHEPMLLISQLFSPIDFISTFPSLQNKPILSCYTSQIIKKHAALNNLSSSAPNTIIDVSRHARTLYVFACIRIQCSQNPGSWKTISLIQSEPKTLHIDTLGKIISKAQMKKRLNTHEQHQQQQYDGNIFPIHLDELEEDEDEYDDEDYEIDEHSATIATIEQQQPLTQTQNKSVKNNSNGLLFDVGDWSDDDDADNTHVATPVAITDLKTMVQETQKLQQHMIDNNQGKTNKDLKKLLHDKKRKPMKRLPPIFLEPFSSKESQDNRLSPKDELLFFKPFYVWWEDDRGVISKSTDYSAENKLLAEYMNDDTPDDINNYDDTESLIDDEDDDGNAEEDPFEQYNRATAYQPDQIIRYFNSNLSLHAIPKDNGAVAKFKATASNHPLFRHTKQSGLWLLNDVPNCECCGDKLTLECQILPSLIFELQPDEYEAHDLRQRLSGETSELNAGIKEESSKHKKKQVDKHAIGLDFGIVNVYSCLNVCNPDQYNMGFCLIHPAL